MIDERMFPSVNILTPEFKAKLEDIERDKGKTLQIIVTPSHPDATIEELHREALLWIDRRMKRETTVSGTFREDFTTTTAVQFLGS